MCPDFKHAKSSRTQEHSTFIFEVIQISQMQNIMTKNHISKITKSPGIQDPLIKVKNETEKHIALRKKMHLYQPWGAQSNIFHSIPCTRNNM
jgi:hypothetical protein